MMHTQVLMLLCGIVRDRGTVVVKRESVDKVFLGKQVVTSPRCPHTTEDSSLQFSGLGTW